MPGMRDYHTVDRSGRRNRNIIYDAIDRVTQIFEAGGKGDIKLAFGKFTA